MNPIFAIFITRNIPDGTLTSVGVAVALFWFTRAIIQIPVANYLDKHKGERDDFRALLIGLLVAAGAAFLMPFATTMNHVYIIEFIHAVAFSLYIPAWSGIFSRHIDHDHSTLDWALDRSAGGFATGMSALLGGVIASAWGFPSVFVIAGFSSLIAACIVTGKQIGRAHV